MKSLLHNQKVFRLLILFVSFVALFTSCSKDKDLTAEMTEDPNTEVPSTSITIEKKSNAITATITGKFYQLYFDQLYHKADGSMPGSKPSIRTTYWLRYDRVKIASNGVQPFKFERTEPYKYVLKYTLSSADFETNRISLVSSGELFEKEF